ncbi:MAG TPA: choice-of-anchor D domain-containing protein [Acidimicrobiales bacterium]
MWVLSLNRGGRVALAVGAAMALALSVLVVLDGDPDQASAAVAASTVLESKTGASNNTKLPGANAPAISADGRFEVFTCFGTEANRCPTGPAAVHFAAVLRDRAAGTLIGIPRPSGTGDSRFPVISRDGCHVAFLAAETFTSPRFNVYRWTRPDCGPQGLVLASRDPNGRPLTDADIGQRPAISASGRIVAYAAKIQPFQAPMFDVKVVDLSTANPAAAIATPTSPPPAGTAGLNVVGSHQPVLTDDGRFVFYTSDWNPTLNAGKGGWNGIPQSPSSARAATQIWRFDRTQPVGVPGSYLAVSGAPNAPYTYANSPAVSGDGNVVAFAARKVGTLFTAELRVISTGVTSTVFGAAATDVGSADSALVPITSTNPLPDYYGNGIAMASDGSLVVYELNRAPGRTLSARGTGNLQLTDRRTGAVQVVSVTPGGAPSTPTQFGSAYPAVNASGRVIAFASAVGDQLTGDGQLANSAQVYARLRPPEVTVGSVDFGAINVASPAAPKAVAVTNTGLSSVMVTGVTSSAPAEFPLGVGDCGGSRVLAPGQSCNLSVGFTPSAVGARSTTITVATAGPGFDFQPVSGAGRAVGTGVLAPGVVALVLEPGSVDFAQVPVAGTSPPVSLVLRNTGTADATIAATLLDGTNAAEFKIVASDCPLAPAKLPIAGFCTVTVAASPLDDGLRTARLSASTVEGPVAAAALSATGVRTPVLQVAPPVVAAGGLVTVSGQSFPRNVSVRVVLGSGQAIQAVTDANGAFSIVVLVMGGQPTGPQTVSVLDDAGRLPAPVTAPLLVVASTFRPQGSLAKPGGIGIVARG